MKMETLSFRDKFDVLLEKRPSSVAGQRYTNVIWEISGESCLGWQVIAFGLGIGFLHKKPVPSRHTVEMGFL